MGGSMWMRYAPHNMMILVQLSYTLMYFVTEDAFNRGLNPYVYVTYRHLLGSSSTSSSGRSPTTMKIEAKMTLMLFLEIFVLSLLGVSLTLNMYFASLKYTSPTFVTAMANTVASITFAIAIVLRMEIVDVKSPRGLAKVAGTAVSFAGVTTMTFYKGAAIASPWKAPIHIHGSSAVHDSWVKGSLLAVASCVCWSIWYIMQAGSVERYPAELSLTAWMATVRGIQSAAFTVLLQLEGGLARRVRPQLLVHHILWDRVQWLRGVRAAVVQGEERPRLRHHVQPRLHHHGGHPGLLHLRRKSIRRKHNRRSGGHTGHVHAAVGQGHRSRVQSEQQQGAAGVRSGLREAGKDSRRFFNTQRFATRDEDGEIEGSDCHRQAWCPKLSRGMPEPSVLSHLVSGFLLSHLVSGAPAFYCLPNYHDYCLPNYHDSATDWEKHFVACVDNPPSVCQTQISVA